MKKNHRPVRMKPSMPPELKPLSMNDIREGMGLNRIKEELCTVCTQEVRVMSFKGTGVCSEGCRKALAPHISKEK